MTGYIGPRFAPFDALGAGRDTPLENIVNLVKLRDNGRPYGRSAWRPKRDRGASLQNYGAEKWARCWQMSARSILWRGPVRRRP